MMSSELRKPMAPARGFAAGSDTLDRNDRLVDSTQLGYLWSIAVMMREGLDMWLT